jgi:hypothetical protein
MASIWFGARGQRGRHWHHVQFYQEKKAMSAVKQDKVAKPVGHIASVAFLALPAFIGDSFNRIFCWLRDEWQLNATIRQLSELDDHILDDIGVNRLSLALKHPELIKLLREGR